MEWWYVKSILHAVILKDFVHKNKIIFSITPTHSWGADIASSKAHNMTKWNLLQSVLTVSQVIQTHFWNVWGLQSWAGSEPGSMWKRWAKEEQETEKESHRGRRVRCREQIRSHLPPWLCGVAVEVQVCLNAYYWAAPWLSYHYLEHRAEDLGVFCHAANVELPGEDRWVVILILHFDEHLGCVSCRK